MFFALAGLFSALAIGAIPLDCWLARRMVEPAWPHGTAEFCKLIHLSEVFASGIGVVALIATASVLDPRGWRIAPRLALLALGSGLM